MTAKDGSFKLLAMSPSGHVLHEAKEEAVARCGGGALGEKMKSYLESSWFAGSSWLVAEDSKAFALEMLGLEAAHAANASAFRIGIVYCEAGQSERGEEACFANTLASERFWSFMDLMGERVRVNSFSGFSGRKEEEKRSETDFLVFCAGGFEDVVTPPEKQSYYVSWLSLEIM